MSRDFKGKFYRTLDLDDESKVILKWFKKVAKQLQNESDHKIYEQENEE